MEDDHHMQIDQHQQPDDLTQLQHSLIAYLDSITSTIHSVSQRAGPLPPLHHPNSQIQIHHEIDLSHSDKEQERRRH